MFKALMGGGRSSSSSDARNSSSKSGGRRKQSFKHSTSFTGSHKPTWGDDRDRGLGDVSEYPSPGGRSRRHDESAADESDALGYTTADSIYSENRTVGERAPNRRDSEYDARDERYRGERESETRLERRQSASERDHLVDRYSHRPERSRTQSGDSYLPPTMSGGMHAPAPAPGPDIPSGPMPPMQGPSQSPFPTSSMPGPDAPPSFTYEPHVQGQFPGQFPASYPNDYRPSNPAGEAADYYGDQGQSVAEQPGVRPKPPLVIPNSQAHLMTASSTPNPPPEPSSLGQTGAAASYFDNESDHGNTYNEQLPNPGPESRPPRPSQLPNAGVAGATAAAATYGVGNNSSEQAPTGSPSTYAPLGPPHTNRPPHSHSHSHPHGMGAAVGAATAAAATYGVGNYSGESVSHESPSTYRPPRPPHSNKPPQSHSHGLDATGGAAIGAGPTYGVGNYSGESVLPDSPSTYVSFGPPPTNEPSHSHAHGMGVAVGAAAAGAATGYMIGHHHSSSSGSSHGSQHNMQTPNELSHAGFGYSNAAQSPALYAAGAAYASNPVHPHHATTFHESPSQSSGIAFQPSQGGPLDKFIGFWRDPEGVGRYEEYTEAIGVCKHCFEPGTTWRDAPRVHHYKRRRSSDRVSGGSRVEKLNRYGPSEDEGRRRNSSNKSWLPAILGGYVMKALFDNKDFDDSYSIRPSKVAGSYSDSDSSSDRRSKTSRAAYKRSSRSRSPRRIGRVDHRSRASGYESSRIGSRSRSRSRSSSRSNRHALRNAALGAAVGTAAVSMGEPSHRDRSDSSDSSDSSSRSRSPRRGRGRGRTSSSSGTSVINMSRPVNGSLASFFTTPSENRRSPQRSRSRSIFTFKNSSSSSVDDDLAFGPGYTNKPRSKSKKHTSKGKKQKKENNIDGKLLALGATAAALAASAPRRGRRPGELLVRRGSRSDRSDSSASDDEGWEDVESDHSSSVSSSLAYGSSGLFPSDDSHSSDSSSPGWGWGWMMKSKKKKSTRRSSPNNRLATGTAVAAGALGTAALASKYHQHTPSPSQTHSNSSASLRNVAPVATSDPSSFEAIPVSSPPRTEPHFVRPGPIPLQQPQPVTPVYQTVYTSQGPSVTPAFSPFPSYDSLGREMPQSQWNGEPDYSQSFQGAPAAESRQGRTESTPVFRTDPLESTTGSPILRRPKESASVHFELTREQEDKERRAALLESSNRDKEQEDGIQLVDKEGYMPSWDNRGNELHRHDKQAREREYEKERERDRQMESERRYCKEDHDRDRSSSWADTVAAGALGAAAASAAYAGRSSQDDSSEASERLRERREQRRAERRRGTEPTSVSPASDPPERMKARETIEEGAESASPSHHVKTPAYYNVDRRQSVHDDYASFFRPEELRRSPESQDRRGPPPMPKIVEIEPASEAPRQQTKENLPWPVPSLNVIEPTPPHSNPASVRDVTSPTVTPSAPSAQKQPERSTGSRVSWGQHQTHEYEVPSTSSERSSTDSDQRTRNHTRVNASRDIPIGHPHDSPAAGAGEGLNEDIEFTATVAAAAEAAGFDPSLVTDDPEFRIRTSPPNSNVRDGSISPTTEAPLPAEQPHERVEGEATNPSTPMKQFFGHVGYVWPKPHFSVPLLDGSRGLDVSTSVEQPVTQGIEERTESTNEEPPRRFTEPQDTTKERPQQQSNPPSEGGFAMPGGFKFEEQKLKRRSTLPILEEAPKPGVPQDAPEAAPEPVPKLLRRSKTEYAGNELNDLHDLTVAGEDGGEGKKKWGKMRFKRDKDTQDDSSSTRSADDKGKKSSKFLGNLFGSKHPKSVESQRSPEKLEPREIQSRSSDDSGRWSLDWRRRSNDDARVQSRSSEESGRWSLDWRRRHDNDSRSRVDETADKENIPSQSNKFSRRSWESSRKERYGDKGGLEDEKEPRTSQDTGRGQSFLADCPEVPSMDDTGDEDSASGPSLMDKEGLGLRLSFVPRRPRSHSASPPSSEKIVTASAPRSISPGPTLKHHEKTALTPLPDSLERFGGSPTAVPLHFRPPPTSPRLQRSPSVTSPDSPPSAERRSRPSSHEFKHSREFRPLFLVERHGASKGDNQFDEPLPSLPSTGSSSIEDLTAVPDEDTREHSVTRGIDDDHQHQPAGAQKEIPRPEDNKRTRTIFGFPRRSSRKKELGYEFHSPSELLQDLARTSYPGVPPFLCTVALPSAEGSAQGVKDEELQNLPPLPDSRPATPKDKTANVSDELGTPTQAKFPTESLHTGPGFAGTVNTALAAAVSESPYPDTETLSKFAPSHADDDVATVKDISRSTSPVGNKERSGFPAPAGLGLAGVVDAAVSDSKAHHDERQTDLPVTLPAESEKSSEDIAETTEDEFFDAAGTPDYAVSRDEIADDLAWHVDLPSRIPGYTVGENFSRGDDVSEQSPEAVKVGDVTQPETVSVEFPTQLLENQKAVAESTQVQPERSVLSPEQPERVLLEPVIELPETEAESQVPSQSSSEEKEENKYKSRSVDLTEKVQERALEPVTQASESEPRSVEERKAGKRTNTFESPVQELGYSQADVPGEFPISATASAPATTPEEDVSSDKLAAERALTANESVADKPNLQHVQQATAPAPASDEVVPPQGNPAEERDRAVTEPVADEPVLQGTQEKSSALAASAETEAPPEFPVETQESIVAQPEPDSLSHEEASAPAASAEVETSLESTEPMQESDVAQIERSEKAEPVAREVEPSSPPVKEEFVPKVQDDIASGSKNIGTETTEDQLAAGESVAPPADDSQPVGPAEREPRQSVDKPTTNDNKKRVPEQPAVEAEEAESSNGKKNKDKKKKKNLFSTLVEAMIPTAAQRPGKQSDVTEPSPDAAVETPASPESFVTPAEESAPEPKLEIEPTEQMSREKEAAVAEPEVPAEDSEQIIPMTAAQEKDANKEKEENMRSAALEKAESVPAESAAGMVADASVADAQDPEEVKSDTENSAGMAPSLREPSKDSTEEITESAPEPEPVQEEADVIFQPDQTTKALQDRTPEQPRENLEPHQSVVDRLVVLDTEAFDIEKPVQKSTEQVGESEGPTTSATGEYPTGTVVQPPLEGNEQGTSALVHPISTAEPSEPAVYNEPAPEGSEKPEDQSTEVTADVAVPEDPAHKLKEEILGHKPEESPVPVESLPEAPTEETQAVSPKKDKKKKKKSRQSVSLDESGAEATPTDLSSAKGDDVAPADQPTSDPPATVKDTIESAAKDDRPTEDRAELAASTEIPATFEPTPLSPIAEEQPVLVEGAQELPTESTAFKAEDVAATPAQAQPSLPAEPAPEIMEPQQQEQPTEEPQSPSSKKKNKKKKKRQSSIGEAPAGTGQPSSEQPAESMSETAAPAETEESVLEKPAESITETAAARELVLEEPPEPLGESAVTIQPEEIAAATASQASVEGPSVHEKEPKTREVAPISTEETPAATEEHGSDQPAESAPEGAATAESEKVVAAQDTQVPVEEPTVLGKESERHDVLPADEETATSKKKAKKNRRKRQSVSFVDEEAKPTEETQSALPELTERSEEHSEKSSAPSEEVAEAERDTGQAIGEVSTAEETNESETKPSESLEVPHTSEVPEEPKAIDNSEQGTTDDAANQTKQVTSQEPFDEKAQDSTEATEPTEVIPSLEPESPSPVEQAAKTAEPETEAPTPPEDKEQHLRKPLELTEDETVPAEHSGIQEEPITPIEPSENVQTESEMAPATPETGVSGPEREEHVDAPRTAKEKKKAKKKQRRQAELVTSDEKSQDPQTLVKEDVDPGTSQIQTDRVVLAAEEDSKDNKFHQSHDAGSQAATDNDLTWTETDNEVSSQVGQRHTASTGPSIERDVEAEGEKPAPAGGAAGDGLVGERETQAVGEGVFGEKNVTEDIPRQEVGEREKKEEVESEKLFVVTGPEEKVDSVDTLSAAAEVSEPVEECKAEEVVTQPTVEVEPETEAKAQALDESRPRESAADVGTSESAGLSRKLSKKQRKKQRQAQRAAAEREQQAQAVSDEIKERQDSATFEKQANEPAVPEPVPGADTLSTDDVQQEEAVESAERGKQQADLPVTEEAISEPVIAGVEKDTAAAPEEVPVHETTTVEEQADEPVVSDTLPEPMIRPASEAADAKETQPTQTEPAAADASTDRAKSLDISTEPIEEEGPRTSSTPLTLKRPAAEESKAPEASEPVPPPEDRPEELAAAKGEDEYRKNENKAATHDLDQSEKLPVTGSEELVQAEATEDAEGPKANEQQPGPLEPTNEEYQADAPQPAFKSQSDEEPSQPPVREEAMLSRKESEKEETAKQGKEQVEEPSRPITAEDVKLVESDVAMDFEETTAEEKVQIRQFEENMTERDADPSATAGELAVPLGEATRDVTDVQKKEDDSLEQYSASADTTKGLDASQEADFEDTGQFGKAIPTEKEAGQEIKQDVVEAEPAPLSRKLSKKERRKLKKQAASEAAKVQEKLKKEVPGEPKEPVQDVSTRETTLQQQTEAPIESANDSSLLPPTTSEPTEAHREAVLAETEEPVPIPVDQKEHTDDKTEEPQRNDPAKNEQSYDLEPGDADDPDDDWPDITWDANRIGGARFEPKMPLILRALRERAGSQEGAKESNANATTGSADQEVPQEETTISTDEPQASEEMENPESNQRRIGNIFPNFNRGLFRRPSQTQSGKDGAEEETMEQASRDSAIQVSEAPIARDAGGPEMRDSGYISSPPLARDDVFGITEAPTRIKQGSWKIPEPVSPVDKTMPVTSGELRPSPSIHGRNEQQEVSSSLDEHPQEEESSPSTPLPLVAEQPDRAMVRDGTPRLEMKPEHVLPLPRTPSRKFTDNSLGRRAWPTADKESSDDDWEKIEKRTPSQSPNRGLGEVTKTPEQDKPVLRPSGSGKSLRRVVHSNSGNLRAAAGAVAAATGAATGATTGAAGVEAGAAAAAAAGVFGEVGEVGGRAAGRATEDQPTAQSQPATPQPSPARAPTDLKVEHIASSSSYDPVTDKGKKPARSMTEIYEGWGETPSSPRSPPSRPPSIRHRRSMQHLQELEFRLDHLVAENRELAAARDAAEAQLRNASLARRKSDQALNSRDADLADREAELAQLKQSVEWYQKEVARLNEENKGLTTINASLVASHASELDTLQQTLTREIEYLRSQNERLSGDLHERIRQQIETALEQKNNELRRLREELENARDKVKHLQQQIAASMNDNVIAFRGEDYFEAACQKLCGHVQQWVLRFSKHSDHRRCRRLIDLQDEKTADRFDNAILDGSDTEAYLADRVRRRDVFMSVVMTMIWEFVFTRYLFGMDREQRQKLKSLEKQLFEVGPRNAVHRWRATTLTLLSRRSAFAKQRDNDTEAVALEIYETLSRLLPPPSQVESQLLESLRKVVRVAVNLSVEMRTQMAEYIMLPPLQPEYDTNGDIARQVSFNASLMNERSGETTSNDELQAQQAVVRVVLFPLVVKKGNDTGEGEDEIVVCPAQVLVARPGKERRLAQPTSRDRMSVEGNRSIPSAAPSTPDMSSTWA